MVIFWFRRDLRFDDNTGLFHALNSGHAVLPVFIFDTNILQKLDNKQDKRVSLIHQRIVYMNNVLSKSGSGMYVRHGNPTDILPALCSEYNVSQVFCNEDYEPEAIQRDSELAEILSRRCVQFNAFKDQVIFAKNDLLKPDGNPYTVFTPYSKKWKLKITENQPVSFSSEMHLHNFTQCSVCQVPALTEIGFRESEVEWIVPSIEPQILKNYADTRNFPSLNNGTSHLSVHLRFGTISIRKAVIMAMEYSDEFLNELIWREFFMMILYHFPQVVTQAFKPAFDNICWRNNTSDFEKWCNGKTGYPLVDAGMRELNATGIMHNRVRMVTASFLVKHLLIDWRWGEAYFAQNLLDYDLSANNGNWQWAAGCGCDAAPYFRVFNPTEQAKKFDKDLLYIQKWVPELNSLNYVPMLDHTFARNRVLSVFKKALKDDI